MTILLSRCVFLGFLTVIFNTAHSEVYKWKDGDGKWHYSDLKPINAEEQKMKFKPAPAGAAPADKTVSEKEMEFRKRQLEAEENTTKENKQLAEAKEREKNCIKARGNLKNLESGMRLVKYDAKGEQVYIEDGERAALIEESKKAVANWCK
ncbi:MAG TPA: DUF4124 domain-containing protein [Burkholderiales bacterium]|nr:DUF4124 domain-containing protein [Burkholderiales bacterium]